MWTFQIHKYIAKQTDTKTCNTVWGFRSLYSNRLKWNYVYEHVVRLYVLLTRNRNIFVRVDSKKIENQNKIPDIFALNLLWEGKVRGGVRADRLLAIGYCNNTQYLCIHYIWLKKCIHYKHNTIYPCLHLWERFRWVDATLMCCRTELYWTVWGIGGR